MSKSRILIALSFTTTLAMASSGFAQTQPDPHHTQQGTQTEQTLPGGAQSQSGMMMPMGEMMQVMGQMMQMMGGGQLGTGSAGQSDMDMASHFEGRIAYLRAELNITKDQEKAWNDFAGALHAAAEFLKDARATHGMPNAGLPAQLEVGEKILSARLEGLRGIKAAVGPLYAVLTEDQRQLADNLLVGPMGFLGPGMMLGGMAQGGMAPGGMMPKQ